MPYSCMNCQGFSLLMCVACAAIMMIAGSVGLSDYSKMCHATCNSTGGVPVSPSAPTPASAPTSTSADGSASTCLVSCRCWATIQCDHDSSQMDPDRGILDHELRIEDANASRCDHQEVVCNESCRNLVHLEQENCWFDQRRHKFYLALIVPPISSLLLTMIGSFTMFGCMIYIFGISVGCWAPTETTGTEPV